MTVEPFTFTWPPAGARDGEPSMCRATLELILTLTPERDGAAADQLAHLDQLIAACPRDRPGARAYLAAAIEDQPALVDRLEHTVGWLDLWHDGADPQTCGCFSVGWEVTEEHLARQLGALSDGVWVLTDAATAAPLPDVVHHHRDALTALLRRGLDTLVSPDTLTLSWDGAELRMAGSLDAHTFDHQLTPLRGARAALAGLLRGAVRPERSPGRTAQGLPEAVAAVAVTLAGTAHEPTPALLGQLKQLHAQLPDPHWAALARLAAGGWHAGLEELVSASAQVLT